MTWYELEPARLVLECERVRRAYPGSTLHRRKQRRLWWVGALDIQVAFLESTQFEFAISYPTAYPAVCPKAFILAPELLDGEIGHKWHRWPHDGSICYVRPSLWQMGTTADEIISKISDWGFNYLAFKNGLIAEMPEVGRATVLSESRGGA